uniref:Cupin domain-containing protein n=1 Tax=Candidatus Kentrum sp. LFY TaxID=2126342 RepID=A0A450W7U7_9GAMM|nr:MAG: Cupin domain-containing protein [Candidatus Kentron sp. LFY]
MIPIISSLWLLKDNANFIIVLRLDTINIIRKLQKRYTNRMTDNYLNKIINPNQTIAYSPGTIVSKIIYKNKHTILTLFAIDAEQSIAEHTTPFDAMIHVLDGEVKLTIGGIIKAVKANESIIMPANIPHALYAEQRFKILLVMMK